MRFNPCVWTYRSMNGWSPRRIAAAKRAVEKEELRVQREKDQLALLPDLHKEIQPDFNSVEERQDMMDRRERMLTQEFRANRSQSWRKARRMLYAMPATKRKGMLAFWNCGIYPADPAYLIEAIRTMTTKGKSPWTYLRKRRLCWLWARGRLQRPPYFHQITNDFWCLSSHPTPRDPYRVRKIRKAISKGIQLHL